MRIVASSLMFRFEPHGPQIEAVVRHAQGERRRSPADHGVVLALENHIDYTSAEILRDPRARGLGCAEGQFRYGQHAADDGRPRGGRPAAGARTRWPRTPRTSTPAATCGPRSGTSSPPCRWEPGLIDIPGVVRALAESGYQGVLAVESDHHKDNQDEDRLVARSVAYLKTLVAEIENETPRNLIGT